ncbi:MAG: TonB-dependent receptor [Bryobacteraceae bacterium]
MNSKRLLCLYAALCLGSGLAQAQVLYGSLVGTVSDQSGAPVPAAHVTITNQSTGLTRESSSDGEGRYIFQNVVAGTYDLKASAAGFRQLGQTGIAITINTVTRLPLALELGQVTEQITVEATAATLQTDKADVHVELGSKEVQNMPLPRYRNYQSLINLSPGATPGRYQNSPGSTPGRALTTNVNGVNRNNNVTKLDGAVTVHIWLPHHTAYVAPAETVETVNISTNNFDAEQGMAGGAATTVTTKSGTNEFHGSAFLLHDNSKLGAKNFFFRSPKTPKSLVTIPGFTAGGPIVKNKLFYFGGWEGVRERLNRSRLYTVATAQEREGNFAGLNTTIYDPATGQSNGAGRQPFAGNLIPASRQSAISRQLIGLLPNPNQPGFNANYFVSGGQNMNRDNYDVKINYNPNNKMTMFGKYSTMRALVTGDFGLGAAGGPCICDGGIGDATVFAQLSTIGLTYTFTPTFLYDSSYGWTRTTSRGIPRDFGQNIGLDVLKIPGTNGAGERESGMPSFLISGYTNLGNAEAWNPYFYNDTSYTSTQNFSVVKGGHEIRFGFEGVRHWLNHWQPEIGFGPRGRFDFNQTVTGTVGQPTNQFNAQAAFLLGLPSTMGKTLQWEKMVGFNWQLGWYVRDRWQVTRNLTLNAGLRYELYPLMTRSGYGGIEQWDETTNLVQRGGRGDNPKGLGITTGRKMFAPRFGLAYRVNDTTVIRSGYGITYNPMPFARPLRGFYPLTIAQDFSAPNSYVPYRPIEQGIPEFSGPDPSLAAVPLPGTAQMRTIAGDKVERGYVQSWNLIVERKLPAELIASVGYVGTATIRSFADWEANAAAPGAGNAGRPFVSKFGRTASTLYWSGFANTNYHSLQVAVNRRVSSGLLLKGAYTWSKAINMTDDDGWAGMTFNYLPHLNRNRARAGYDVPHMLQMAFVYELPFGKGKSLASSGPAAAILGGWQANGVFASYKGRPFSVGADGGSLNAPGNSQTADQVKSEVTKIGSLSQFYDTSAFARVTEARFGSTGRNILRGPGAVNLDFSLFRDFRIKERLITQFRAEAFNLTNTPHFNNPGTTVGSSSFMQITSAADDQRTIRLGLRFQW